MWKPRPLVQTLLTLADAVELTLEHSPAIARARYDVALAAGRLQEARGVFDPTLTVVPGGAYLHEELTPALRGFERNRRNQLDILATAFDGLYRGISEALNSGAAQRAVLSLRADVRRSEPGDVIIDRQDPLERRVLGVDRDVRQQLPIRIDQGIIRSSIGPIRLGSICRAPGDGGVGAGQTLDLAQRINQAGRYRLEAVIDGLRALPEEINRFRAELAETIAVRARLAWERLGALPRDEIRKQIFLEASLSKPLRNGLTLRLDGRMESEERNFEDKPLDPDVRRLHHAEPVSLVRLGDRRRAVAARPRPRHGGRAGTGGDAVAAGAAAAAASARRRRGVPRRARLREPRRGAGIGAAARTVGEPPAESLDADAEPPRRRRSHARRSRSRAKRGAPPSACR